MNAQLLDACVQQMLARGFDKAQARFSINERDEMQAEFNQPSMLRTVQNRTLELVGIVADKRATVSLNQHGEDDVRDAVQALWDSAAASPADPANDIAAAQPSATFATGPEQANLDQMADRLDEFLAFTQSTYPRVTLGMVNLSHVRAQQMLRNSNGVAFASQRGRYDAGAMFTARDGEDVSSFSFSGASYLHLDQPIAETGSFDRLLANTSGQVRTQKVPRKFTGDLIVTPECVGAFTGFLLESISRGRMVADTSIYKGRIGEQVAASSLTLRSHPLQLAGGYSLTGDGYPAENMTIVEDGILRSFLLDQYAANKTGLERAPSAGGCYVIDPGSEAVADMIADVREGVLITRFSGGRPSDSGDFSGVAKNSYYIHGGEIQFPISETMVSGNLAELLVNIQAVSRERVDSGSSVYPWLRVAGIGIS
jgi:PmbA protein